MRFLLRLALPLLLLAPAVPAQEEGDPGKGKKPAEDARFLIDVRVGFADRSQLVRVNRWNPVFIELENRSKKKEEGIKGELVLTHVVAQERVDRTTTRVAVELPASSKKLVILAEMIEQNDEELLVELMVGRDVILQEPVPFPGILRIGDSCEQMLALSARRQGLGWLEQRPQGGTNPIDYPVRYVVATGADQLPRNWIGWDAIDALVIDDPETLPLDEDQVEALACFVRLGGTLLVTAGRNWQVLASSRLESLLPASLESERMWNAGGGLDLGEALAGFARVDDARVRDVPGVKLTARSGKVVLDAGGAPVAVVQRVGLGRIAVVAYSASEPALRDSSAAHDLVAECLGHPRLRLMREPYSSNQGIACTPPTRGYQYTEAGQERYGGAYAFGRLPDDEDFGWRDLLENAYGEDLLTKIPAWRSVFLFLLVYFFALGPCNYLVFRKLDRLEYAWPASIVIALGFTGVAYAVGLRGGAGSLAVRHLTVIEAGSGSPDGRAVHLLGLAGSGHVEGDFQFAGAEVYVSRMRTRTSRQGHEAETVSVVRGAESVHLEDFRVLARAIRGVEVQRRADLGEGGVEVELVRGHGRWTASLANRTGVALDDPVLVLGAKAIRLEDLPPGAERRLELADSELQERRAVLASWCNDGSHLHPVFGGKSRQTMDQWLANEGDVALPVALLALLPEPGFTMDYEGEPVPAFGPTILVVPAACSLAQGEFDLPGPLWACRVVSAKYPGFWWGLDPREVHSNSVQVEVELEPLCWAAGARVARGALTSPLVAEEGAEVTRSILSWPEGKAPVWARAGDSRQAELPVSLAWVRPGTGRLRLRVGAPQGNIRVGPILLHVEGTNR